MKRVFFESKESVGHIDVPDDAIITTNEDDEEMEDQAMYPVEVETKLKYTQEEMLKRPEEEEFINHDEDEDDLDMFPPFAKD